MSRVADHADAPFAIGAEAERRGPIPRRLLPDTAVVGPDGRLGIGGCDLAELAEEFGTPLFVYDEAHLRDRCRQAFAAFDGRVSYAGKAFLCTAMARLVLAEGLGIDVASAGELETVLRSVGTVGSVGSIGTVGTVGTVGSIGTVGTVGSIGTVGTVGSVDAVGSIDSISSVGAVDERAAAAARCVLHGNNKSLDELELARRAGVGHVVVDGFDELDRLDALHERDGIVTCVLVRVTPGVRAETHDYISTGQADSKFGFGVSSGDAATALRRVAASAATELVGIHFHIGSQVFDVANLARALDVVAGFAAQVLPTPSRIAADRSPVPWEISVGGGLGVPYVEGEHAPTIAAWGATMRAAWARAAQRTGLHAVLSAEPGRAIAAAAAVTVYTVGALKTAPGGLTLAAVDGGYGDNPRPVLYGSDYTTFLPTRADADRPEVVRLVGKHCESGDVLVRAAPVPTGLEVGDFIATPVTGAYGYAMGSSYNRIGRPAVVFVADGAARPVLRRETLDDLLALDCDDG